MITAPMYKPKKKEDMSEFMSEFKVDDKIRSIKTGRTGTVVNIGFDPNILIRLSNDEYIICRKDHWKLIKPTQKESRPDFDKMNAGINQIVQEYHFMMDCIENIQIDKDKLELLRAKAWWLDTRYDHYGDTEKMMLKAYRNREEK